jgi:hypothetical protein
MVTYLQFRMRRYGRWLRRSWRKGLRYIQFNAYGKWRQFAMIRRFVIVWWLIILVTGVGLLVQIRALQRQGLVLQPLPGGSYSEALVGTTRPG